MAEEEPTEDAGVLKFGVGEPIIHSSNVVPIRAAP